MNPVPTTVRTSGSSPWYVSSPTTSPSANEPLTLTTNVPYGKRDAVRDCTRPCTA